MTSLLTVLLFTLTGCTSLAPLEKRMDTLEQQQARQYYLLRCDWCDAMLNPGSKQHEECIILETRRWEEVKRRRGWR